MAGGKVFLVGAGPGDSDYLTLRGRDAIASADVLVYDALADERLLSIAPAHCQLLNVGKRGGVPSPSQTAIDAKLVDLCHANQRVVRLKSGDPFIFARSASEIQALNAAQCEFEVIPGISSVLAAPLLAGIPLTDPVLSRGFAVFSAHDPDTLDWESLARLETLVFLMGGRNLRQLCDRLIQEGRAPRTPIAIIRWAGREIQRVWTGTLEDIAAQVAGETLSPSVIVIGEVVSLRSFLQPDQAKLEATTENHLNRTYASSNRAESATLTPQPKRPLAGQTILVTRAAGQSSEFLDRLEQAGATAISLPALEIRPPSSWNDLDRAITDLDSFDWLILTSSNAVEFFCDRLFDQGRDLRSLANLQIAVVGQKTAKCLRSYHLQPDYIPPDFVADALVEHFPETVEGRRILFPRVETGGREVLVRELSDRGAIITEVAAYESGCPAAITPAARAALLSGRMDIITFASSKTVRHFAQLVRSTPDLQLESLCDRLTVASIGPQTTIACREELGRCDLEAEQYTIEGLQAALEKWAARSA
jgi:uroporphyrinogen III methyltransferase/synthase